MTWLAIAAGGAIGSLLRHVTSVAWARFFGQPTPYATFTVNMVGSFVIGFLAGLIAANRVSMTPTIRVFIFVGILGGFTTFSTYMLDSLTLAQTGQRNAAFLNVGGQIVLGYALAVPGYRLGL